MDASAILSKFNSLPEDGKSKVADFIDSLLAKMQRKKPLAEEQGSKRKFGSAKGMFVMAPDFDEPLEDFKEYI